MSKGGRGNIWAVTSYYNPARYRRRLENFWTFVNSLSVPLLVVELTTDGVFELPDDAADMVLRYHAKSPLWQKERLINLARAYVPQSCDILAWIDCDVMFDSGDWPERLTDMIASYEVVQLFGQVRYLPKGVRRADDISDVWQLDFQDGFIKIARSGRQRPPWGAPGIAWAARRTFLERFPLYDTCVVGGGDVAWAFSLIGAFGEVPRRLRLTPRETENVYAWGKALFTAAQGRWGYIDQTAFHLWHGDRVNRSYTTRHDPLVAMGFNAAEHLQAAANMPWEWHPDAPPELRAYVAGYFFSRREDG